MKKDLVFYIKVCLFVFLNNFLLVYSKGGNTDSLSEALASSSARLTCDTSPNQGEQPQIITWYRLGGPENDPPIYTYDARQQPSDRWSDVTVEERIYMRIVSNEAQLTIDPVDASDEGQYKCKVDFRRASSRSQIVNLTVVGKLIFLFTIKPRINNKLKCHFILLLVGNIGTYIFQVIIQYFFYCQTVKH